MTVELSEDLKLRLEEVYDANVVKKGDLGDGFFQNLSELQENEQIYVIDKIKETDFSKVRSVEGFSNGIIRRVKDFGTEEKEPDFTILGEEVKERLETLIANGKFDKSDIDFRVVRTMQKLAEEDRKIALSRYEDSLDDSIRSRQGFFMGIVKRMLPQRGGPRGRGRGGGRDRGYRSRFDQHDGRYGRDRYGSGDRYGSRDQYGSGDRHRGSRRYDRY